MVKAKKSKKNGKSGNRCKYSLGFSVKPDWERKVWLDNLPEDVAMRALHILAPFSQHGILSVINETVAKRMRSK